LSTGTRGAVAHDTSVVMIKQTHSKRIAGNADARVRPALLALAPAPIGPKPREQRRYLGGDRCGFPCISAHLAREDRLQIISWMLAPEELRAVDTFRLNIAGRAGRRRS
jgi:hypothetical protein